MQIAADAFAVDPVKENARERIQILPSQQQQEWNKKEEKEEEPVLDSPWTPSIVLIIGEMEQVIKLPLPTASNGESLSQFERRL